MITGQKIGMALVKNIPSTLTDLEIRQFFSHNKNVTSVLFPDSSNLTSNEYFCWIGIINPEETFIELNNTTISGTKLRLQLMGYFYPDQSNN